MPRERGHEQLGSIAGNLQRKRPSAVQLQKYLRRSMPL